MINIGIPIVNVLQNNKSRISNDGHIIFHGWCNIGTGFCVSVSKQGVLEIGSGVHCSGDTRIVCYHHINIENDCVLGWDLQFMDTDLHQLFTDGLIERPKAYGPIRIGEGTWIANGCNIYKNTDLPIKSVISAHSMCNKDYSTYPEKSVFAGIPAKYIKTGYWKNRNDNGEI